jgi:hypothetical protein
MVICAVALILLSISFAGCSADEETTPDLVKIMVNMSESTPSGAAIIAGDNPVYVNAGETASFDVTINAGFKLVGIETIDNEIGALTGEVFSSSAVYENGVLRVDGARYPSTFTLSVRPLKSFKYYIENNIKMGEVVSDVKQGIVKEDTAITVTAAASDDYIFVGWSKDALMENGGQFLSYSPEYALSLTSDMLLFPNYLSKDGRYIKYNSNGGALSSSASDSGIEGELYYEINTRHYPCPNAFADTGIFTRGGYALLEYNTARDGSGVAIGLGANVGMIPGEGDENRVLDLYAQWVKYTDESHFTYTESNGKITITDYSGDDETIVIPEEIGGVPVTAIAVGAIDGAAAKTIFITKNVTNIASEAIMRCPNLQTLYLSDSVIRMSNVSVKDCPNLANLYVNAVTPPRYFQNPGWGSSIKYKRLLTAEGKRIIVISGSSSAFGLTSPLLEEELGGEYAVVNYGTHAGSCAMFFYEFTSNQIREGDIVVLAPEPFYEQQSSNEVNALLWQLLEGAYDSFRLVDIRNYTNVFASFAEYNATRYRIPASSYDDYITDVNVYGDILTNQAKRAETWVGSPNSISFINYMTRDHAAKLNRINDEIIADGGRVYLAFSPTNFNALTKSAKTEKEQTEYQANIARLVDFPVISNLADYIFPGNYFSDTDHHLAAAHMKDRTLQLAADLKAQFERGT